MSTPAIGRNTYRADIAQIRMAEATIRRLLNALMDTNSEKVQSLAGRIALQVGAIDEAVTELDAIGRSQRAGVGAASDDGAR